MSKRNRSYKFQEAINKSNNYLRNLKCGTTNIQKILEDVIKTWQVQNELNRQDAFYLEGSYVKFIVDNLAGEETNPISDIDFHAEIKQHQNMRNQTENFAKHLTTYLEKYHINYKQHTNFKYKRTIPNITIIINFSNQNFDLKFKDPTKLEFEFTITPTIINPLEITGIPKIIYKLDHNNKIKIDGINLLNSYTDIVPNYTRDADWPSNWSDMKSKFLDRLQNESTGYKTLSDHMEQTMSNPRPDFKPWEEFYSQNDIETMKYTHPELTMDKSPDLLGTSALPMSPDDLAKYNQLQPKHPPVILVKPGLDMSVEERLGKVLGTWFTKTHKITDNIIYMIAALLYTKGAIKDGMDSLIAVTKAMFEYLISKNISKETQRSMLINYALCIIYAMRYNFGTGCKRSQVENVKMQFFNPDGSYYFDYQPRIFVTNEYLLTNQMIYQQYKAELTVLTMMLSEMYTNVSDSSIHNTIREMLQKIENKIFNKCMQLNDQQDIDQELFDYEVH